MVRAPSEWRAQIRREVLDQEIECLRELPHSVWVDLLRAPMTRRATGRDGEAYRLKVAAARAARGSDHVRVTVTLQTALLRRSLMRASFVITPDNRFVD